MMTTADILAQLADVPIEQARAWRRELARGQFDEDRTSGPRTYRTRANSIDQIRQQGTSHVARIAAQLYRCQLGADHDATIAAIRAAEADALAWSPPST